MSWVAGEFSVKVDRNGVPTDVPVVGWISGLLALDFRVFLDDGDGYRKGWVLTHLPTGFVVAQVAMPLDEAIEFADEIAACTDWDFTDPAVAPSKSSAVRPIFDRLGRRSMRGHPVIGPIWHEGAGA